MASAITLEEIRSTFDRIAGTRTATAKDRAPAAAASACDGAGSRVHPEDHYRRAAHWAEGEPGGRGDRQGLCDEPLVMHSARQHAAGRCRRERCNSRRSIGSTRHACGCFIPSGSCWPVRQRTPRSLPVLRACAGRGQVRRHPRGRRTAEAGKCGRPRARWMR